MTKKDFSELAEQLAIVRREIDADNTVAHETWHRCVQAVMLACRTTSANFNPRCFCTACGMPNILPTD